jgi:hypothetical protein
LGQKKYSIDEQAVIQYIFVDVFSFFIFSDHSRLAELWGGTVSVSWDACVAIHFSVWHAYPLPNNTCCKITAYAMQSAAYALLQSNSTAVL